MEPQRPDVLRTLTELPLKVKVAPGEPARCVCNRMLAQPNAEGKIAGRFVCHRCKRVIEV